MGEWVDFKAIKERFTMQMVLDRYGVKLRPSGKELRGKCPIHEGKGTNTFHASLEKNVFQCFSCKAKGNVLDFVAAMEKSTVRDAALKLQTSFGVPAVAGDEAEKAGAVQLSTKKVEDSQRRESGPINPPLAFQLRVDPGHEYGLNRGLSRETLEHFGAGFCLSKGTFAGRFVNPLHDEQGRLVGYAGRAIDDKEPKYLFPSAEKGFHKRYLLFNLHRRFVNPVPQSKLPGVVVVEGFFDCMKLYQAGFSAVALLGSSLSQEQEEILCQYFREAVLLFDGDDAGRKATEDCLLRLGRRMFVKAIELPDGKQPDMLSTEDLRELLKT